MKVIAARPGQLLIAESIDSRYGEVIDLERKYIFPEDEIAIIIKGGYWEKSSMPDAELQALIKTMKKA